jgi:hypothetical protein
MRRISCMRSQPEAPKQEKREIRCVQTLPNANLAVQKRSQADFRIAHLRALPLAVHQCHGSKQVQAIRYAQERIEEPIISFNSRYPCTSAGHLRRTTNGSPATFPACAAVPAKVCAGKPLCRCSGTTLGGEFDTWMLWGFGVLGACSR